MDKVCVCVCIRECTFDQAYLLRSNRIIKYFIIKKDEANSASLNVERKPQVLSMNTWSPADGSVWGTLGAAALLEEVSH